ncbi:MAG: flagellar hook-associated protein FlgK [Syntrophales bacterium]
MTSISTIMSTTLSALNAQQAAVNITGNNIANVNTDGYSRQDVVISSTLNGTAANGKRVYDAFLTNQISDANQDLGKCEAETKYLDNVEVIFDESEGSGLSEAMSDFWNGWQDLVNDPSDSSARSLLAAGADTLATAFNSIAADLAEIQAGIDDDIVVAVGNVNSILEQIADLNQRLVRADANGQDTGAYKDSIDSLVSELSSLVDVNTHKNDLGQTCIQLADGKPLVEGGTAWSLATETNATKGLQDITWIDEGGIATVVTDDISGGKLGGCLEVRDTLITVYQKQLDALAVSIMEAVNDLHTDGYDLEGKAGGTFFTGTGAEDMAVTAAILADPSKIAAASADGATGDGTIAASIAALADTLLLDSGTSTFSEYYNSLVGKIGAAVETATTQYETLTDAVTALKNLRDSVSGVSLDEETTKLALYQNAYAAAAKVMTALDEMLKTMIEM